MWIFFNIGILDLKIPVLTTYLRTMWKLARAGNTLLTREKLVEGKQKPDTLSDHLSEARLAGVLYKIKGKSIPINGGFISEPNEYLPINPTHKMSVKDYQEINDAFSYKLQEIFGLQHTKYYIDKYDAIAPKTICTELVTAEDFINHRLADSLETPLLPVKRVINIRKQRHL